MGEEENILREAIEEQILFLAYEGNGTHVLQKIIQCLKVQNLGYLFDKVCENLIDLAYDPNGLCVVKKVINKFTSPEHKSILQTHLSENCVHLVQSPYGNYAIQEAIDNWPFVECEPIYENLL